jgi:hypothetical protein
MYESLNVGGSGAYPIVQETDGFTNITFNAYNQGITGQLGPQIVSGTYYAFLFDKNSVGQTDGSGNPIKGAWLLYQNPAKFAPVEIQVKLVNEVNELYQQGQSPTHMWMTMPGRAMTAFDPDVTSASDYPANVYNVIMNGTPGWSGLCAQCGVFFENSNETWNSAGAAQADTIYYQRQGILRWPTDTGGDVGSFSTLRAIWVMADIQSAAAYQANKSRTRFVMAGQFGQGVSGHNNNRFFGNNGSTITFVATDNKNPLNTRTSFTGAISGATLTISGSVTGPFGPGYSLVYSGAPCVVVSGGGSSWTVQAPPSSLVNSPGNCPTTGNVAMTASIAPMAFFDKWAGAAYADNFGSSAQTIVAQGASDYTSFGANSSQVTTDLTNLASNIADVGDTCIGGAWNSQLSCNALTMTMYASAAQLFGPNKEAINYEGGLAIDPSNYSQVSPNVVNFVNLLYNRSQWTTANVNWQNAIVAGAHQGMPALLGQVCGQGPLQQGVLSQIWSWACPDTFSGTTEGAGMGQPWLDMGTYNNQSP